MATKYNLTNNYGNSKCASTLLNTDNWISFLDNSNGEGIGQYAIGGPTLEMWCESWNTYLTNHPDASNVFTNIRPGNTDTYGYKVSSDKSQNQAYLYMNGTQDSGEDFGRLQTNYPMYFPHEGNYSDCSGYWLSSPSADGNRYLMLVSCGGCVGYSTYNSKGGYGLRPVVCLKSTVSATKVGNVWQLQ